MDWESCTLTRYDNDYQNAKESLEGLQNIVFIAIAVVSVICFLVLALFLTLRLRGRIHETGVYLAMGISKGSVLLQYLLEVILVAAIALLIAYGTSTAISHQIGSSLLSQVTTETYETVDLTGKEKLRRNPPKIWALPRSKWPYPPRITPWCGLLAWCCVWLLPHWRPTRF